MEATAEEVVRPVPAVVGDAAARSVEERRRDPGFRRLLDGSLARHAELLGLLADDE